MRKPSGRRDGTPGQEQVKSPGAIASLPLAFPLLLPGLSRSIQAQVGQDLDAIVIPCYSGTQTISDNIVANSNLPNASSPESTGEITVAN